MKNKEAHNTGLHAVALSKMFGTHQVLSDVSMHVNRGEAVGLLGPNGAGKTTSFSIISGLISATSGSI